MRFLYKNLTPLIFLPAFGTIGSSVVLASALILLIIITQYQQRTAPENSQLH
ncbi:MAG: hypothetical protein ACOYK8_05240 [Alphaproteobacteria bacterium]